MLKTYIDTGKIVNTHGLRGDVKMEPWTDDPQLFCEIKTLYLDDQGQHPIEIEKARLQKGMVLLKLKGIDTIEAGETLRGKILYIHRDDIPMEEGEYLIQDLLGCRVLDVDTKEQYGTLVDVTPTGANDVYHIRFADGTVRLCPVIPDTIIKTDVQAGEIEIRPLKGLFDDED